MKLFQFFGLEDSIYNHLKLIINLKLGLKTETSKSGENLLNKRQYTV